MWNARLAASTLEMYTPGGLMSPTGRAMTLYPPDQMRRFESVVLSFTRFVDFLVDARDLSQPDMALVVFHFQDILELPMEMVGDISRLLP
jgi:hypothetical protein